VAHLAARTTLAMIETILSRVERTAEVRAYPRTS
jgi:hypothetical protein